MDAEYEEGLDEYEDTLSCGCCACCGCYCEEPTDRFGNEQEVEEDGRE